MFVFFQYAFDPPESIEVFRTGDLGVIAEVEVEDAMRCFPADWRGRVTAMEGDTLFPEEVILLRYAPRVQPWMMFQ